MDVMAPELMWTDGKCYRLPNMDIKFSSDTGCYDEYDAEDHADTPKDCEDESEEIKECPPIHALPNGKHKMSFPVARVFVPFIIGSKGHTIKRISTDTSCYIHLAKFHEESKIIITGPNRRKVTLAWSSIAFVINSNRKKLSATHFVSIPLNSTSIQKNMVKFKEDVLNTCSGRGVNENIFQDPGKLHLTIVVLVLADHKERELAVEKLWEICNKTIQPMLQGKKPLIIEVSGLDLMNDDPSQARVLYATPKIRGHPTLLQDISNKLSENFQNTDLVKEACKMDVKLHATVLNHKFQLKDYEEEKIDDNEKEANRECETFDATNIIKKFKNFNFGEQELKTIHLSIRFTRDKSGYYKSLAVIDL